MANAVPVAWKCSECSLEYETEDEAKECCDVTEAEIISEDAEVEDNEEEIDESDDDDDEEE